LLQAPPLVQSRAVAPDGVSVAVQDWAGPDGPGARQDVLLLHGFSQFHKAWLHQIVGSLGKDFRLVTYDLRGHGASDKPTDASYYQDSKRWGDEVDAVIRHAKLVRPVLIAWSYAGRIALDYLSIHGAGNLAGLVMVNATSKTDPSVLGPAASLLRLMCDPDPAINVQGTRDLLNACVARQLPPEEFEYMLEYNLLVPAQIRANLRRPPADYAAVLEALRLPTLIIHGAKDPINRIAMSEYTHAEVQDSTLLLYDDAAHMPFWEAPARFNADVTDFIRRATG
jgi:pimeloyl-ACP methyl ester carboxylesterase